MSPRSSRLRILAAIAAIIARFFARPGVNSAVTAAMILVGVVYSLLLRASWNPQGWQLVADEALLVYLIVRGEITGLHLYHFIDVVRIGHGRVLINAVGALLGFAAIALALVGARALKKSPVS